MVNNMSKRSNKNRHLVSLVLYKNKWVYYNLEDKNLYFSISKRPSNNHQLYTVGITLLSLPLIRMLNALTIFSIPTIKYTSFILCSCLSLLIGKFVVDYSNKDLDLYPALFTDIEYLEFSQVAKKNASLIALFIYVAYLTIVVSLVAYFIYSAFLGLLIYSVFLFVLSICLLNNVHKRNKVIKKLIRLTIN